MITNTKLINFKKNVNSCGSLIAIESQLDLPFEIKRVYYIFDVEKDKRRGFHSHNNLKQVLICIKGSVKILIKNPYEEKIVTLDNPQTGLYIGSMVWREMFDFSKDAVLLVLASEHFDLSDYTRDYDAYKTMALKYYGEKK